MTSIEQADNLLFLLNRANAGSSFAYNDAKLSRVLTIAQWHYIYSFVNKRSNQGLAGLEATEIRGQGLSNLISQEIDIPNSNVESMYPNSRIYELPEDFMWCIDETVLVSTDKCTDVRASVRVVTHDEVSRQISNIYKKPTINSVTARVWRLYFNYKEGSTIAVATGQTATKDENLTITSTTFISNSRHELIFPENWTDAKYSIRYLKLPRDIVVDKKVGTNNVDCELDPQVHQTIVEIARDIMLDTVKEQKLQSTLDLENLE
jgi:hypothetical protein